MVKVYMVTLLRTILIQINLKSKVILLDFGKKNIDFKIVKLTQGWSCNSGTASYKVPLYGTLCTIEYFCKLVS